MTNTKKVNIWIKRVLSLMSIGYIGIMAFISFTSLFYDVVITDKSSFIALEVFLGLLFGGAMLYTRKQFLTSITGLFGLLLYLPILIFYYSKENMIFVIPLGVIAVLIFFFSGAGEGLKTIVGTIYLLLYVICILVYYLYISLFSGHTVDVVTYRSVSPSQDYRCYVLDITDSSKGTTKVVIEPNNKDIVYNNITFVEKGYNRTVYNIRQNNLNLIPEWSTDSDNNDVLTINGEVRFRTEDAIKEGEAYSYFASDNRHLKFFQ